MRSISGWISRSRFRMGARFKPRFLRLEWGFSVIALCLISFSALLLSGAAPEKHLSVYSTAANYSLPIVQREGHDYIGLLELLEPLGKVSAHTDGIHWRLRYYREEDDFQSGKTHGHIQGRDIELPAKFILENNRGLVSVSSLTTLLPRVLGGPVTLHEESERLFIGGIATHFTASLAADNPPRLIFNFTAPVSPTIATEAGTLRMTFSREPVVAPASPNLTFGNKSIPSANYREGNGTAVVTVNSTIPVIATFSNDGKTITVAPAASVATAQNAAQAKPGTPAPAASTANAPQPNPSPATSAQTAPAAPSAATQPTIAQTPASAPNPAPQIWRRYFAVVDASHGGDDHGETLNPSLLEKDVTVSLAHSLRQELESRGITTLVLRDSDANLPVDQRAIFANADHAAIYIALHAASHGPGVRVYTALLPYAADDRGPFRSWPTAQRNELALSQSAASAVAAELQKRQIPVRTLAAPLRPLNNVTGAAIAVEVAPEGSDLAQLTAPDYQQLVTSAVATAIASAHDQLGAAQ
jgi:N-acetylmuramoyl-L-alanine amidase